MKISKKMLLGAAGFVCLTAGSAFAQDAAPDWALTGALSVQSDYRFRGISQDAKKVPAQGSLSLTGPDGWYAGTWLSQVDWDPSTSSDNPSLEWDIFAGKHFDLGGTDLNVEAYYYAYPAADYPAGTPGTASYFEGIFQLTHDFGGVTAVATYSISPEWSFDTGVGNNLALGLTVPVMDWLSVSANVGHQWIGDAPTDYTYADFGATATWKAFSLDARYVTTDIGAVNCAGFFMATRNACSGGFVGTLTYTMNLLP